MQIVLLADGVKCILMITVSDQKGNKVSSFASGSYIVSLVQVCADWSRAASVFSPAANPRTANGTGPTDPAETTSEPIHTRLFGGWIRKSVWPWEDLNMMQGVHRHVQCVASCCLKDCTSVHTQCITNVALCPQISVPEVTRSPTLWFSTPWCQNYHRYDCPQYW